MNLKNLQENMDAERNNSMEPSFDRKRPTERIRLVLTRCLILFCSVILVCSGISFFLCGRDPDRINIFGYRFSFVLSESMEPTIRKHALCLTELVHREYREGDVVVYKHFDHDSGDNFLICHRIVKALETGMVVTKGDHNESEDSWEIPDEDIIGKIVWVWNGFATFWNL